VEEILMSFRDDLEEEQVHTLPLREAIVIHPDTSIREAVMLMRAKSLGCAVIVDADGSPTGVFTEQSLLDALTQTVSLDATTVSEFLDPHFLTIKSSDPISRVWDAIEKDGLRFVCVTNEAGALIGITGQRGIAEYVAESFPQQVLVQRLGSAPWMQKREGA
jgi:CBS domain-containing protein